MPLHQCTASRIPLPFFQGGKLKLAALMQGNHRAFCFVFPLQRCWSTKGWDDLHVCGCVAHRRICRQTPWDFFSDSHLLFGLRARHPWLAPSLLRTLCNAMNANFLQTSPSVKSIVLGFFSPLCLQKYLISKSLWHCIFFFSLKLEVNCF